MAENRKSAEFIIKAVISVSLVFVLLFTFYGSVFGEVESYGTTYISDVQVFSGDSLDSAIKKCEEAGFTPVKKNINHSAKGDIKDNGIYVAGYKTTEDIDESITGISLLQMNSGYQNYTYGDVAERAVEKLGDIPDELSYSINEFYENYKNGSPAAAAAVEALNCYCIDELGSIGLGDYMVSGKCTVDFVKKILVRSSTSVVSAFCNSLVAGVADYGESSWATRLEASSVQAELEDDANYSRLDVMYKVLANELVEPLQDFAAAYHDAYSRYTAADEKLELVDGEKGDATEISGETVEDMTTGGEIQEENGDSFYLYAYDMLNNYNYNETTKLGDYIVSLGDSTYTENAALRKIYPLVDSLTDGQIATMRLSGVACSAIYLVNDSGISDVAEEQVEEVRKTIREKTGNESISVWTGTDQTIYNQKVAVTTDAYRANSAGQIYNSLTSPDDIDDALSEAMSKLEIIMTVVGIAYGVTFIAATAIGYLSAFTVYSATTASVWAVCCAGIGAGVFGTIFGCLGCAIVILNYIALIAMVIVLVALLIKYLWDLWTDDDAEDFTEIPTVVFDSVNNRYVKYTAVTDGSSAVNINGSNARRWNALYVTKSRYAGDPVCSGDIDDLITVQYDDSTVPQGYEAVRCFGEVSAANLNANSKSDSASIFMFFKTTVNEINEGEEQITEGQLYISKLSLSVESSETAAKAALTKSGYKVLDVNLTPALSSIKRYTYIGFTTTTNADDAITDIRISPRNTAAVYVYGNASYTSCGSTATGDTLYYTSYKSAGSPITADLHIENSLETIPEGYEPVNMFCGGNAFNFNVGRDLDNSVETDHSSQEYDNWGDKGMYLYFRPSVVYTEGEEYISGLVLVAGNKSSKNVDTAEEYINALGLEKFDLSLTYASKIQLPSTSHGMVTQKHYLNNVDTYICYTTTHNPYRAIYGVRSYTSAPGNYTVPAYIGSVSGGGYAVCDVLFELPYTLVQDVADSYYRGIYATHSYQFACVSGSSTGLHQSAPTTELLPEDYEDVDWTSCGVRGKGLYVLGPTEGGTPLTVNDITVTDKAETQEGFAGVQDFKTPNRTEPNNLGYRTENSKYISDNKSITPVYMYVRQETPVEKKYISSICVSTYTLSKATGGASGLSDEVKAQVNASGNEYCIQTLLSECTDEIVQANIAVDRSKTFYSDAESAASAISYIGVSRTDNQTQAITGIIRYVTDKTDASPTIMVNGISYIKAGDMINDPQGSYYLYYTTSAGANPGMPITSVSVSSDVFETGCATALSANETDTAEITDGGVVVSAAHKASTYGDEKTSNFIHMKYEDTATMMGAIYIGHGKTAKEAQCNLLSLGCNMCIDMDVNRSTGGEYIYVGYANYTLLNSEKKKGVAKYAVRDVILTVGEAHQKTITVNGVKYKSAIDEYTSASDSDGTKAVSLNSGTGGKQIYLYYTTTMTADTQDTISSLGFSCRDYAMLGSETDKWENVLDADGNRVNLNEGAISTTDNGKHITDNRMYMYVARTNGNVKAGSAVDSAAINSEFKAYDVYMKGA